MLPIRFAANGISWPKESRRKRGLKLIGTIPTFGWRYRVGLRSLGLQLSLGVWHCYVLLEGI